MLSFVAMPAQDVMAIGNQSIQFEFRSQLPDNVEIVAWTGAEGHIEYNDRPRLIATIIDPAPYYSLINAWLGAAASLQQPLTLDQARQIKKDMIASLYFHKRQLPYSYLGYQWAALDKDVAASAIKMIPPVFGGTESGVGGLIGEINARIDQINVGFGQVNVSFNSVAGHINHIINNYPQWNAFRFSNGRVGLSGTAPESAPGSVQRVYGGGTSATVIDLTFYDFQAYAPATGWQTANRDSGAPGVAALLSLNPLAGVSHIGAIGASPDPAIPWEAVDVNQVIRLTITQASALMQAISDRNEQLLIVQLRKIGEVQALATLAEVIAYDATAGWP